MRLAPTSHHGPQRLQNRPLPRAMVAPRIAVIEPIEATDTMAAQVPNHMTTTLTVNHRRILRTITNPVPTRIWAPKAVSMPLVTSQAVAQAANPIPP